MIVGISRIPILCLDTCRALNFKISPRTVAVSLNIFRRLKLSDLSDLNFVMTSISQLTLCFSDLTLSDITGRQTAACVGNDLLSFPWLFFLAPFSEAKQLSDLGLCEFDQHQYINKFGLQETMVPEPTHQCYCKGRARSGRLQTCFCLLSVCWFLKPIFI